LLNLRGGKVSNKIYCHNGHYRGYQRKDGTIYYISDLCKGCLKLRKIRDFNSEFYSWISKNCKDCIYSEFVEIAKHLTAKFNKRGLVYLAKNWNFDKNELCNQTEAIQKKIAKIRGWEDEK